MKLIAFASIVLCSILLSLTNSSRQIPCGKVGMYFYPVNPQLKGELGPGGWDCFAGTDTCIYFLKPGVISSPPYTSDEVVADEASVNRYFMFLE